VLQVSIQILASVPLNLGKSMRGDTSQTYLWFLMIHACFYTICLVFRYTSWRFYAISETNLLTRCHSASSLFSAIFVFQKSYIGNILGIGRNKFWNSYFSRMKDKDQTRAGGGLEAGHTTGGRGPAPRRAHPWWGHPGWPLTTPLWWLGDDGARKLDGPELMK
jgi:hypothetical protein